MKTRLRKKDRDKKGNQRYVLEWLEGGKKRTFGFTARKLLDYLKKSNVISENSKE